MNYSRKNWKNTLYINAIPLFLIAIIFFISEKTDRQQNTDDLIQIKSIHSKIYSFPKEEKKYTEGNLMFNKFFKYTINGLLNQTFQYKTNTLFSYTNYYYDTNNLLMQSKEYNSDNTLYLIINYTHDKKGFVTRADYIRTDQKLFNDHRNPVNVEFEKFYKNLFTYIVYINDFMGNVVKKQYYTADNKLSFEYTYRYDYKYNTTEIKYYNNKGSVSWRKKIKYNHENLLTGYKLFMSNRLAMTAKIQYKLDLHNNWI